METSQAPAPTELSVVDADGQDCDSVSLAPEIFSRPLNEPLVHQVVVAQQAAARAGTHSTKTRGEVRGGGRKPYKQKGTGRARQGSTRAPQFAGGGTVHGPKPRNYGQRTNKRMIAGALRSVLSERVREGGVHVVADFGVRDAPKTRTARRFLDALDAQSSRHLVVLARDETNEWLSFRNLADAHLIAVDQLNALDVANNPSVVFSRSAFALFVDAQHANLGHTTAMAATDASELDDGERGESSRNSTDWPIEVSIASTDTPQEDLVVAERSGDYSSNGTQGFIQRLVDGEYVQAEHQRSGATTVMWSSDLDWPTFLQLAVETLGLRKGDTAMWWASDRDEPQRGNLADLVKLGDDQAALVEFCRLTSEDFAVVWRQPFRKLRWDDEEHSEVGLVAKSGRQLDRKQITTLMQLTGSNALQQTVGKKLKRLDRVLSVAS